MARGGRSHGRSHFGHSHGRSHFGHHHHHHYGGGGRGMSNSGAAFGAAIDIIANTNIPPTVINGVYTLSGSQINVTARLNQPINIATVPMMPMVPMMPQANNTFMPMGGNAMPMGGIEMTSMMAPTMSNSQTVVQANITVAGSKISEGSACCYLTTILLASFIIIPIFFICCMWWKKIVYPRYEISAEFYRVIGTFLRRENQCRMLNLTVVDNAFNAERARLLHQSLSGSQLTGFQFMNLALACNHNENEADSFTTNMMPLKSLPFPTQITWDDMII